MRIGYTMWARQTIDSDVFSSKPDKWFKIWFYLVSRVNFTDTNKYKRGECFISTNEVCEATKSSTDQVKKCLKWLRQNDMVFTKRSTRGLYITVLKYNVYQDNTTYKSPLKAPEKHQRSTTIVEEGKKERTFGETSSPLLNLKDNNKEAMSWNKQSEDYEEGVVDLDGSREVKPIQKQNTKKYPNAPTVRKIFQEVLGTNPADWKKNTTILQSCENLYTERGVDKIRSALEFYQENKDREYCPVITSPIDLDRKYQKLSIFKTSSWT